ncbi:hypothetical protein LRY65_05665 [Candidatus Woesebacteria bacterium]|nr:hypothetical protein [Candidatus Woesebacteria bacterium]MCD8506747.1 hypothetical protein [Candidatus Woesebacteria bacterium]MCD8527655.1 hypothetical protein [Candidatus Woesebacteria bacterium]MCD8546375.1 hypothetical protein [Candidatus Woesebacteria bacterium]
MKIFLISPNINALFSPDQIDSLKQAGDVIFHSEVNGFDSVEGLFTGDEDRILAIDPDFCDWKVPNDVIERIPHLKAIVLQTTSFSWLDVNFAKTLSIPVINLRGFSKIAVAEWATMMVFALARRLPVIIKDEWKQDYIKHQGIELRGKTAGIIGLGNIGRSVAENMAGLGMKVQYWSKNTTDDRFERVELSQLMKTSDVIIPTVAQNEETHGLITDEMLGSMKKTAIFASIIHNVYNHDLLLKMVANDGLFGYGFEESKPSMLDHKGNVWAGPELAWCTEDSMRKNAEQWVEAIIQATKSKFPNRVN